MAWRPPYQPQLPPTTWGSLAALHCGQMLRAGALSVQLEARRVRDFIFEVFFLGTAIGRCLALFAVGGAQLVEDAPPRIHRGCARAGALVAVDPAVGAQTQALLSAEGRLGQLEHDSFARQRLQVDLVVVERVGLPLLVGGLEHLPDLALQAPVGGLEAAGAGAGPRG